MIRRFRTASRRCRERRSATEGSAGRASATACRPLREPAGVGRAGGGRCTRIPMVGRYQMVLCMYHGILPLPPVWYKRGLTRGFCTPRTAAAAAAGRRPPPRSLRPTEVPSSPGPPWAPQDAGSARGMLRRTLCLRRPGASLQECCWSPGGAGAHEAVGERGGREAEAEAHSKGGAAAGVSGLSS